MRNGICRLENGASHVLTFSDCHPKKFTCDSGHCIELDKKCDGVVDCEDGSDEMNCEFIIPDGNYLASSLPLTEVTNDAMKVSSFHHDKSTTFWETMII